MFTVGLTVILKLVAPVDHKILPIAQALAVKVVELPEHTLKLLPEATEIVGAVGVGFTVTVTVALSAAKVSHVTLPLLDELHPTV